MKVKVFHIRLSREHLISDQENLNQFMDQVVVKKTSTELINGQPNFWSILLFYEEPKADKPEKPSEKIAVTDYHELTTEERKIYETLKAWQQDEAMKVNLPAFMICRNTELMTIAKLKPQSIEALSKIKGFGGQKLAKYGEDIIAVLNSV